MKNFGDYATQQGWTLETQVEILLQYIDNQGSDDVFTDFLDEQCEDADNGPYRITVQQTAEELTKSDDRINNPSGVYRIEADTEDEALDLFHGSVPIACLDDFDIIAEPHKIIARFQPQKWIKNHAVDADPLGPTVADLTAHIVAMGEDEARKLTDDDYSSDDLRFAPGAPEWWGAWSGPFLIEVAESIRDYFYAQNKMTADPTQILTRLES